MTVEDEYQDIHDTLNSLDRARKRGREKQSKASVEIHRRLLT